MAKKEAKETERGREETDEEKEDKEWKEVKKEKKKNSKNKNKLDLEKSNIPGMHKISKIKDTIKLELIVSMKAVRIER